MNLPGCVAVFLLASLAASAKSALVLQSDFGLRDGAVAAMKGVAFAVDAHLPIFDLSHLNRPYDIWEGAYRLKQTAGYWPAGTVFVSVIDPGVGTDRKSVVLKTKSGHYFVGPDNGTWTLVAEDLGIEQVRQIDETKHRLKGSAKSYTFHGRDVYAYAGARLASGQIVFEDIGPALAGGVVQLPYTRARRMGDVLEGGIPQLDVQYGNVWTNVPDHLWEEWAPRAGDRFKVSFFKAGKLVYEGEMPFAKTFGEVPKGSPLLYLNSLLNLSVALNQGSFSAVQGVEAGADWSVRIERLKR
ncbi:MAG: S-adenosyl-l-methionine hydroxide adenosyltransferase family protein [Opitutaceae bacterium]|nr:S-adenosyl-l-methionine hydroxide adenosyltransferase family protein [Opitutaceae bacterium]